MPKAMNDFSCAKGGEDLQKESIGWSKLPYAKGKGDLQNAREGDAKGENTYKR